MVHGLAAGAARRIEVHGHRGARTVLPENSIAAFEYAIAQGADLIELDVLATKDDVAVVVHDAVLNRKICSGPGTGVVRQMTLAEVRQWDCGARGNPDFPRQKPVPGTHIPTLDEVLALAPRGTFRFNIELKIPSGGDPSPDLVARLAYEAIRKHGLESRVLVQSFDFRALHAMRALAPGVRMAALWSGAPRDLVSIAREAGTPVVAPQYTLIQKAGVEEAHKAGLEVVPWTVNESADWDRMIEAGVDGIITDDPGGLIQHLKSKGLR
ncbi:MAG: glycerophosphodiester phosphodiesterase [Bryobacterales bacterium]|nr:glycerophosphodiester phosphodiesterase [Bryobacterales bacterium]